MKEPRIGKKLVFNKKEHNMVDLEETPKTSYKELKGRQNRKKMN